jgi:hypothetical protein
MYGLVPEFSWAVPGEMSQVGPCPVSGHSDPNFVTSLANSLSTCPRGPTPIYSYIELSLVSLVAKEIDGSSIAVFS